MSYKKILQQASFRGIKFHVESSERKMGFNYKIHVFPGGKRKAYAEELSEQAQILPIDAFLIGPDASYTRDLLIEACRKRSLGKLHHPLIGYIDAKCKSFRVREVFNKVGKIIINMEFIEVEQESSSMFPDLGIQDFLKITDDLLTEAALELNEALSVLDMPAYAMATAAKIMEKISSIISSSNGFCRIPDSMSDLADVSKDLITFDSIKASAKNLAGKFDTLMEKLNLAQVRKIQNSFKISVIPANYSELSNTEKKEIKTNEAITRYVCVALLIGPCRFRILNSVTNKLPWQNTLNAIDSLMEQASDSQYEKLYSIKTLILKMASKTELLLKAKISEPTPSLLVAYDQLGNISLEQRLIEKNDVENPFEVTGEIEL